MYNIPMPAPGETAAVPMESMYQQNNYNDTLVDMRNQAAIGLSNGLSVPTVTDSLDGNADDLADL